MKPEQKPSVNKLLVIVVIILIATIGFMLLRPHPQPPLPPPVENLKTTTGIVVSYRYNPHLDINNIQIKTDQSGILSVDFRPHTARTVMGIAALNDTVAIEYASHPDDEASIYQLHLIKNKHTGMTANLDDLPPPPRVPPDHAAENFTIDNPELITDHYGGVIAIRSQHLLFHLKPGQVDDILALIKNSKRLSLMAVWRDNQLGFVNVNHDKVYIVISITVDNKTFLVR